MTIVGNTAGVSNLPAGQYFLEVVDENGCVFSGDITAAEPAPLIYGLDVQPASCPGVADGSASLQLSGGLPAYSYTWSDIGAGPAIRNGMATGNYTVTVSDLNGCSLEIQLEIESPQPLTLDFATSPTSCAGSADGQATAMPSGGAGAYTFAWTDGQNTPMATGLAAGPVSVTVTDGNGCQVTDMVVIEEATALVSAVEGTGPGCFDGSNGSAFATAQGGAGNYSYLWSNGQSGAIASGLPSHLRT